MLSPRQYAAVAVIAASVGCANKTTPPVAAAVMTPPPVASLMVPAPGEEGTLWDYVEDGSAPASIDDESGWDDHQNGEGPDGMEGDSSAISEELLVDPSAEVYALAPERVLHLAECIGDNNIEVGLGGFSFDTEEGSFEFIADDQQDSFYFTYSPSNEPWMSMGCTDTDQDGVFDACWTDIDIEDGNGETSWCGEIWEKDKAPLMPDVYVALAEDAIRFAQARLDCRP